MVPSAYPAAAYSQPLAPSPSLKVQQELLGQLDREQERVSMLAGTQTGEMSNVEISMQEQERGL